jgi:hypothetical protein
MLSRFAETMTMKEAAAECGVKRSRMQQLAQAGRISSELRGGARFFLADEVREFAKKERVPGRPRSILG